MTPLFYSVSLNLDWCLALFPKEVFLKNLKGLISPAFSVLLFVFEVI